MTESDVLDAHIMLMKVQELVWADIEEPAFSRLNTCKFLNHAMQHVMDAYRAQLSNIGVLKGHKGSQHGRA